MEVLRPEHSPSPALMETILNPSNLNQTASTSRFNPNSQTNVIDLSVSSPERSNVYQDFEPLEVEGNESGDVVFVRESRGESSNSTLPVRMSTTSRGEW